MCVCVNDANDKKTLQQQSSHNQLKSKTTTISSWPALLIKINSSVIAQDLAHPQVTRSYPIWIHSVSDSLTLSFAQIFDHISQDLRVNLLLLIWMNFSHFLTSRNLKPSVSVDSPVWVEAGWAARSCSFWPEWLLQMSSEKDHERTSSIIHLQKLNLKMDPGIDSELGNHHSPPACYDIVLRWNTIFNMSSSNALV